MRACTRARARGIANSSGTRSLARAKQSPRGIVALARCHGRVKISKSTGFARWERCGDASARRTSARQAARRNNDDDHAYASRVHACTQRSRPCRGQSTYSRNSPAMTSFRYVNPLMTNVCVTKLNREIIHIDRNYLSSSSHSLFFQASREIVRVRLRRRYSRNKDTFALP